ncbi:hypothetical protein ACFLRP_04525 [Bacteroidota bacterium]
MKKSVRLIRAIIMLASGCTVLGIVFTFVVIGVAAYTGLVIDENLWILAIPVILSVSLNILFIELYLKCRK